DLLVDLAVTTVAGVIGASVSVHLGGSVFETARASGPDIRAIDEAQYQDDAGPCVETIRSGTETLVAVPAPQWAAFSDRASESGVRSVWSLPLTVGDRTGAAFNLYLRTG